LIAGSILLKWKALPHQQYLPEGHEEEDAHVPTTTAKLLVNMYMAGVFGFYLFLH
jgi:hypothetical protein